MWYMQISASAYLQSSRSSKKRFVAKARFIHKLVQLFTEFMTNILTGP